MRVLVVVHGFPPAAQGGSEIYAFEHARTLRHRHGDEVFVLTREADATREEYSVRREDREGLRIAWINNTFQKTRSFEETYDNPQVDAAAKRLIDEFRPDVAHIHHLTCLSTSIVDILAERCVPTIFTLHDFWLICHRGQLLDIDYRVCGGPEPSGCHNCLGAAGAVPTRAWVAAPHLRAIERALPGGASRAVRQLASRVASWRSKADEADRHAQRRLGHMHNVCDRVTTFLAPSRFLRDRFVRFGIGTDRIALSRYGFDHGPFRQRRRAASSPLRFGFLGSLMISKAPDVLLEAFARLPRGSASLHIWGAHCGYHGDDSYRERLRPLLAATGVTVEGAIPHDRVADALASIDVLVVPSIWPENSPLVIHEAFLAGVPVVASRIGGIPELVEDGRSGLLFQPGDPEDLHRVLLRLVREPELAGVLRAGAPRVRTIEDDVDATRRIYETFSRPRSVARAKPRRLAAVVLNYRTPADTFLAVKSLLASKRRADDLFVVDNGSNRDCRLALEDVWSKVAYVETGENRGFSGGVNVGIRAALDRGADEIVLINSDVVVAPDCLERLEAALTGTPGAGIAGPAVLARCDPGRVASLGISYDAVTGRMRHRAVGEARSSLRLADVETVDAVSGCAMLIAREVFESVGLFDEDYFFTFEDLDFCLRARRAGFATILAGSASAYHEGSRSIGAASPQRLYFAARNHLLLAARNDPSRRRLTSTCRAATIVALNLAHAAISSSGRPATRFLAVARGTRDYVAGRFGAAPDDSRPAR